MTGAPLHAGLFLAIDAILRRIAGPVHRRKVEIPAHGVGRLPEGAAAIAPGRVGGYISGKGRRRPGTRHGLRVGTPPASEQTLRNPVPVNSPYTPLPKVLIGLAGIIAVIEIVLSLSDRGILFDPDLRISAFALGAFWTGLLDGSYRPVYAGQPVVMFVSHAFLHGSFLHMAMNTTILLALGRFVEMAYSPKVILPLFLLGALGGGAAYALIASGPYPMVGASGAVFAFLGLWVAWDWRRHRLAGVSVQPIVMRVVVLAGLNVAFYFGLGGMLAWEAHLGGFLAGLFVGALLERQLTMRERAERAERRRRSWNGEGD
ncbi:rhomboid family intramembrane serine protease [Amaricoccus macauensis]|uniref:rhomboid family intramembrane serine protease n=1 Tax=Amaricoccus macauensis TaxID=57001 RepID=UPI003C7BC7A9